MSRICISCRTLLGDNENCAGKNHRTVDLAKKGGAGVLEEEVWGRDSRARALRRAARQGAGGGALGGILDGCDPGTGCDIGSGGGEIIGVILAVIVFAVAAVLLGFLVRALVRMIRDWMDTPKPEGALLSPPRPKSRAVAAAGVVKSGTPIATPWKAGSTFAYAMDLFEEQVIGGGAMLREARTGGFEVTLDDGRTLRVPEGRVRIDAPRVRVDTESRRLKEHLASLDPEGESRERRLFPWDYAKALTIGPGDRVEVLGDVEVQANPNATGYRANAGVLVPVGVPVLRVRPDPRVRIALEPEPEAENLQEIAEDSAAAPGRVARPGD